MQGTCQSGEHEVMTRDTQCASKGTGWGVGGARPSAGEAASHRALSQPAAGLWGQGSQGVGSSPWCVHGVGETWNTRVTRTQYPGKEMMSFMSWAPGSSLNPWSSVPTGVTRHPWSPHNQDWQ